MRCVSLLFLCPAPLPYYLFILDLSCLFERQANQSFYVNHGRTIDHKTSKSMTTYKAMLKSELAQAAGVSLPTFRRWLLSDQEELRQMGVSPATKILPPVAVRYLCEKYCIEID